MHTALIGSQIPGLFSFGYGSAFGLPTPYGYGDLSASLSYTPYGIQINTHYDWNYSASDYWQSGQYYGGSNNYQGGSLDISTLWSPWGVSQTIAQTTYEGWSSFVNGPNYSVSFSHGEVEQRVEHHERSPWASLDSSEVRSDTFDFSRVQTGGAEQTTVQSTHVDDLDLFWNNGFQQGQHHEFGYESFLFQETRGPGYLSQHTESYQYHSSDSVVENTYAPPFMLMDKGLDGWFLQG